MKNILIILLLVLLAAGCRSKQKVVQRSNEKMAVAIEEVATIKNESVTAEASVKETTGAGILISDETEIELTQADPNKVIRIIDAAGNTRIVQGANVKLRRNQSSAATISSEKTEASGVQIKNESGTATKKTNIDSDKKSRETAVKIKGPNTWFVAGGFVLLMLIGFGIARKNKLI